jgi:NTE family protein
MSQKVALVLSSGGARGIAHIGVIEAMLELGYEISSISGCSMGAVVGAVYAADEMVAYKNWLCNLDKLDVFKLIDFTLSTQGFIRGERVFKEMKKFLHDRKIEDLKIPFSANAVDIMNGEEIVFTSGSIYKAIRASSSIPSVMKPSIVVHKALVDGGVLNPLPINNVSRIKGDQLIVSNVNAPIKYVGHKTSNKAQKASANHYKILLDQFVQKWGKYLQKKDLTPIQYEKNPKSKFGYLDLMNQSINLMQDQLAAHTIKQYQPEKVVNISRDICGAFDFYQAEELIEAGKQAFYKVHQNNIQS